MAPYTAPSMQKIALEGGNESTFIQRLTWLMLARVMLSVGIGLSFVFLQATSLRPLYSEGSTPAIITVFVTIYLSNLLFILSLRHVKKRFIEVAYLQLATDCFGSGALIFFTGGFESPLIFLFALHVIVGATTLSRQGAWFVVVLSSGALILIGLHKVSFIDFTRGTGVQTLRYLITTTLYQIGTLCFIATLTSYLSEQITSAQRRLSFASADMQSLRRLNDHLLLSIHNGIIFCGEEGNIRVVNQAASRLLGSSSDELLRKPLYRLFQILPNPLSHNLLATQLGEHSMLDGWGSYRWEQEYIPLEERMIGEGQASQSDLLETHQESGALSNTRGLLAQSLQPVDTWRKVESGSFPVQRLILNCTLSSVLDEHNTDQISGWVLVIQDVTQRRHLEARVARRERLASLGEVAAQIAHEVRNPLAGMVSSIELLRSRSLQSHDGHPDPLNLKLLTIVEREAQRINQLTESFLRFSRPPIPQPCRCVIRDIVDEVSLLEQIEIRAQLDSSHVAWADPDQVKQILLNLVHNAVEAGSEWIEVDVFSQSSIKEQKALVITIADRGEGFAQEIEDLEEVFQPFFTHKSSGTGLGLALCRALAEGQGGQLEASRREGGGAVLMLTLPINPEYLI